MCISFIAKRNQQNFRQLLGVAKLLQFSLNAKSTLTLRITNFVALTSVTCCEWRYDLLNSYQGSRNEMEIFCSHVLSTIRHT